MSYGYFIGNPFADHDGRTHTALKYLNVKLTEKEREDIIRLIERDPEVRAYHLHQFKA